MSFRELAELVGILGDALGVVIIAVGTIAALGRVGLRAYQGAPELYRPVRVEIGRAILLGLEVLVAADIIRTVAVEPTFDSLLILGGIVLIRTFLSFTLEVELTGRWPWQRREPEPKASAG